MKLVLKILALPVLFVVKVICVLGNLLTNVVSYVIGILLLVIGGSAIYCIVKALWQSLLMLLRQKMQSFGLVHHAKGLPVEDSLKNTKQEKSIITVGFTVPVIWFVSMQGSTQVC